MVIFHSYVSLPEGTKKDHHRICASPLRKVCRRSHSRGALFGLWLALSNRPSVHRSIGPRTRRLVGLFFGLGGLLKDGEGMFLCFFSERYCIDHGSLNVPMFHITQPLGIWSIMATIFGDVRFIPKSWDSYQPLSISMFADPSDCWTSAPPRKMVMFPKQWGDFLSHFRSTS